MKRLILYLTLLIISGCQAVSQTMPQPTQISTGCSEKPKTALNNPEKIQLNGQKVSKFSQVSVDKSVGYAFEAQAGQKLSYRTTDNICIWLFAPDTTLLASGDLPQSGTYTIQISVPQGSTTFNLEMSLGSLEVAQASVPSPSSQENTTSETSASTSEMPTTSTTEVASISQDEALELVQNWYKAKPRIFGPAFDQSLVDRYATGKLHWDKVKPGGSIDWLRSNNSYYTYDYSQINKVISFSDSGERPSITLNISEELYLHGPKGIDRKSSGEYSATMIYFFEKDNGVWKIYDYYKFNP